MNFMLRYLTQSVPSALGAYVWMMRFALRVAEKISYFNAKVVVASTPVNQTKVPKTFHFPFVWRIDPGLCQ